MKERKRLYKKKNSSTENTFKLKDISDFRSMLINNCVIRFIAYIIITKEGIKFNVVARVHLYPFPILLLVIN